ncbi:MAG TPA: ankyrin repeat domain-containing protein [Candidatus Ozemobacteraceae bacterium]|nr:ankyrin repeat domain-containing protein [Candidatus Ozemobacteraceae bacterium]
MEIMGSPTDFERMLDDNFLQRYDACRNLLRANGIQHDVESIRQVMRYFRDGAASPEERAQMRLRARDELVSYILKYHETHSFATRSQQELNESLLDACYAEEGAPLFGTIPELIRRGADVKARDDNDCSAFMMLMPKARGELLRLLLEHGADPNEPYLSEGRPVKTVWLNAIRWLDPEDLRQMLDHGARADARTAWGSSALMEYCSGSPKPEGVALLLERGADPTPADEQGNTALHALAKFPDAARMMPLLLDRKADANARNKEGNTPLHIVAGSMGCGNGASAACLLGHGANPDLRNEKGDTPLHLAVQSEKVDVVEALVKHGAALATPDGSGRTAYQIALAKQALAIAKLIDPEADAAAAYAASPDAAKVRQMRKTIIEQLRAGHTFATGNREGSSIIFWSPDRNPPCYTMEIDDLGGQSSSSFETDEELLAHLFSQKQKSWEMQTERDVYEEIMSTIRMSPKRTLPEVASRQPLPGLAERLGRYKDLLEFISPVVTTETELQATLFALGTLYSHSFGYSDRQLDMQALIPRIFGIARKRIRSTQDLLRLCAMLPRMMKDLPEDSVETPVGYMHHHDLSQLEARALIAKDMDEFTSPFPIKVGSS